MLVGLAIIVVIVISCIRIVPQATAQVIERLGTYRTTWSAGFHIKWPFIETVAKKITLMEQVADFPPQPVITKDNVRMQIDTVVFYQITDCKLYAYGVTNPLLAIESLTSTTLRNIIGELDLDQTLTSRDIINTKMRAILDEATDPWGIKVNRVELKNIYRGETELSGVGMYSIYFDLSGMSREEMEYLMLTSNYRMQMDTTKHGAEEFYRLYGEYVSGGGSGLLYPNEAAGEYHRPMLCITWTSLIEDFDTSLDLILELYTQTDFSDLDMLTYLTAMSADYWDMSRQDANSTALNYAHSGAGLFADQYRFEMDVDGQDCYYLMADAVRRLESEEGFAQEWAARLNNAVSKAFTRDNLIFMCVADGEANDAIVASAVERLNALPEKAGADAEYTLPDMPKSLAICVESTINEGYQIADFMNDADFEGRYLPFWYALSDLYTTPTFRFKLGVYTAGNYYEWAAGCLATMLASDPNVRASVEALAQMPQALYDMELTEESLDGYILSAYSAATAPQGMLDEVMGAMKMDVYGADAERILEIKRGIRNATLSDQAEAAEHISALLEDATYCVVGNEGLIRADADCFDEVVSWRSGTEEGVEE